MSFLQDKLGKIWHDKRLQEAVDFAIDIVKIVIISLVIIIPVRYFLIQPFYVKGASMEPSFYNHEYLIINEINYRFSEPQRGDVVVFRPPNEPRGDFYIKRIIGLPKERVKISSGKIMIYGDAYPDGIVINESLYLPSSFGTSGNADVVLKDNQYFVLGDNRSYSLDSRMFGPITKDEIVGKVWVRGWPFSRLTVFTTPHYNL